MRRREFIRRAAAGTVLLSARGQAPEAIKCYMPGDTIDSDVFALDSEQKPVRLLDAAKPGNRVIALAVLGGAYLTTTDKHGGIWCEDTLDEFANLKAANNAWKDKGVHFIAVMCPPVYSDRYGWSKYVFLDEPEDSPSYRKAAAEFIGKCEDLRKDHTIPFDTVYYDLRFRFLWNPGEHPAVPAYGKVFPWQGKFKWHKDEQRYGTPVLWFLGRRGTVLREPLYGNSYYSVPPKILYTYWELEAAIGEAMSK